MDSVMNKSNNLQISNSFIRKENKDQTVKSINTAKNLNKNIIFTKKIVDEINKNEIEEELRKIKTKNNSVSKQKIIKINIKKINLLKQQKMKRIFKAKNAYHFNYYAV